MLSYDQQQVSDSVHFVKGNGLITYFPMSTSEWVTLSIAHFAKGSVVISFPMTNSLWVTLHIIANVVKGNLITSFPMNNSKWVALHIWWKAAWSHLFIWPTGSEPHCTVYERQSHHHIFSYEQKVSDAAHFAKCSHITSLPMTNGRVWVTSHICESLSYDQQEVSDIAHFVKGSLITPFPIINRKWVTSHILWKAVSSHPFLHLQLVSDIAYLLKCCVSYDQQMVSDIGHFVKANLRTSWPMTNSKWVTLHILWKAISSIVFYD